MWILYALGAQLLYTTSVFIDKILLEKYMEHFKTPVLMLYSTLFSLVALPVLFAFDVHIFSLELLSILKVFCSGILSAVWLYFYLSALEQDDTSLIMPFFQFIPIFGMVLGYVFLNEHLTTRTISAIFVVVVGSIILSYEREAGQHTVKWRMMCFMLLASFFVALSQMCFKWGATEVQFFVAQFWVHVGILFVGVFIAFIKKEYWRAFIHSIQTKGKKIFSVNLANEGINALGNVFFGFALLFGLLPIVQASEATQPLLVFLGSALLTYFAPHLFKESFERKVMLQKSIGIGVVLIGSLALYL